jgi:hypothetical protein
VGEDTNLIEHDIRETRRDLARNLDELGSKARDLVSWESQYRNHAQIFLGAAFGAGLVFGLAALPRRNGHSAPVDQPDFDVLGAETYAVGPPPANGNGHGNATVARVKHELGETLGVIADGLVRAASASAVMYLSGLVPRFGDHIEGRYAVTPSARPSSDQRATHGETE